ncbi:MAG: hypothetical protein GQ574_15010 [Crocinitomix sp.]|nr:hypothetical protein [Crocinitomix sp.]
MTKRFIKQILITQAVIFLSICGYAQESSPNKFEFRAVLTAQTPFSIPNGFYNKNHVTTNYFRSGYGLGVDYKINDKWQLSGAVAYYQSFVKQHFYFGGFGDDADFYFRHVSPELGLNFGINRTMMASEKSRLSWSIELQPWINLNREVKSSTRRIPDGLGGKRDSQITIRPNEKIRFSQQLGLRYDYFGKTLNYGFALELHLRQSGVNSYDYVVEDWFTYSSSYTTTSSMLSFSGFIGF